MGITTVYTKYKEIHGLYKGPLSAFDIVWNRISRILELTNGVKTKTQLMMTFTQSTSIIKSNPRFKIPVLIGSCHFGGYTMTSEGF